MLFAEEHDGIWSFIIGLVVLVMVGVGLSIVFDRRNEFTNDSKSIRQDLREMESQLDDLRYHHEEKTALLVTCGRLHANLSEVSRSVSSADREVADRLQVKECLSREVATLEAGYSKYRSSYRRKIWANASGESLGTFVLKGGKEYRGAVITRVTEVGLEIRHEHGISRLHAPDLPLALQDRFQWNENERRDRLRDELGQREPDEEATRKDASKKAERATNELKAAKDLRQLRARVASAQAKVGNLSDDLNQAVAQARTGAQPSMPGSLETWRARAKRLQGELNQARSDLGAAEARLAAVAPNDPLLVRDVRQ